MGVERALWKPSRTGCAPTKTMVTEARRISIRNRAAIALPLDDGTLLQEPTLWAMGSYKSVRLSPNG